MAIRRATEADIPFLMATERGEGYDRLVGRWDADQHARTLADPLSAVFVDIEADGFVICAGLDDPHSGICLKRIAVGQPGRGQGRRLIAQVIDWAFESRQAPRIWLDVLGHNERAQKTYLALGFQVEGRLRMAYRLPDNSRCDRILMALLPQDWADLKARMPAPG